MVNDPSIATAIAAVVEKFINNALKYDPATRAKLISLDAHMLHLACESPKLDIFLSINEQHIRVLTHSELTPDVKLSGRASEFFKLIGESHHSLAKSNISVSGKVNILNQIKDALSDLDIDWEDMLAEVLGVIPANIAATVGRTGAAWFAQQKQSFERHLPEYLTEELRAVPSKTELENFFDGVDDLKSSSQRLEAKLRQLTRRLENAAENKKN